MFTASFFCVKWFFLKKNLSLQVRPGGRRRRLPKEATDPCQPGFFSHFAEEKSGGLQAAKNRLESREACLCFVRRFDWSAEPNRNTLRKQPAFATFFPGNRGRLSSPRPRRPARFRARRRYTQRPFGPQPDSFGFSNFLADSRSPADVRRDLAGRRRQPAAI